MRQVRVILSEDILSLGEAGELVNVKPGYARNFLIPEGKAIPATEARMNELDHHRRVVAEKVTRELKDLNAQKRAVEGAVVEIAAQIGEAGKLFGSVTTAQIAEVLAGQGHKVDRRKLDLPEPIKEAGEYEVPLRLHRDVTATIKVKVVGAA
jgi:large subunit ribosomal protein L9